MGDALATFLASKCGRSRPQLQSDIDDLPRAPHESNQSMTKKSSTRDAKVAAARKRKAAANKDGAKRKRKGNTGTETRQARSSQVASGGTKQAREATRSKLLREIRSLAMGAITALEEQDYEAVREKLTTIAQRGDK